MISRALRPQAGQAVCQAPLCDSPSPSVGQACFTPHGVEFATEAHSELLRGSGLLSPSHQLLARQAVGKDGPWQALIIDDCFSRSVERPETPLAESQAARLVDAARECYDAAGILGSPHKDVNGADLFQAAGAQKTPPTPACVIVAFSSLLPLQRS